MIEKTQQMNALLDAYAKLLTNKQQEIMSLYFQEDFSLSEIAEELQISRAAVNDHIKRSTQILQDYEKKLQLVHNYETRLKIYDKIKKIGCAEVNALIEHLENLDY